MQLSAVCCTTSSCQAALWLFVRRRLRRPHLTVVGSSASCLVAQLLFCLCADFRPSSFCGGNLEHACASLLRVSALPDQSAVTQAGRSSSSSCRAAHTKTGCHAAVTCCSRSPVVSCCLSLQAGVTSPRKAGNTPLGTNAGYSSLAAVTERFLPPSRSTVMICPAPTLSAAVPAQPTCATAPTQCIVVV